jgi:hypothetical protein
MRLFPLLLVGFLSCVSLPPKGAVPDVIEVRFKSSKDSIISKFKSVIGSYIFQGVKASWIKVIAYVGQVPGDTLNYIKIQGLIRIVGTRPWDNEIQVRPIKKGTPYYKELERLIVSLEERLGEKGNYEAMKREVLLK